jgi:hypothetical protein
MCSDSAVFFSGKFGEYEVYKTAKRKLNERMDKLKQKVNSSYNLSHTGPVAYTYLAPFQMHKNLQLQRHVHGALMSVLYVGC